MKRFDLLIAALLMLVVFLLASTQGGCHWEETVDVGVESAAMPAAIGTGEPAPFPPPPEVMVVECEDGEAHGFYPGHSREQLATIHAMGHLLAQPGDYLHRQAFAYITTGEVWVDCADGYDYVTFILR